MGLSLGSELVVPLAGAHDRELVGAKAASLGRMLRCGIPVPPGFVVTRRGLEAFLRESSLAPAIARLENCLADRGRVEIAPEIPEVSSSVRSLVLGSPLPAGVREGISGYWAGMLDHRGVIVRSSGIGEDSADASFAGLLDSFPDVTSEEELERALKACWASQWSDRSLFYQLARGRRLRGMGVVMQLQVRASISGVLFTQPPTSSETPGTLVGEFVYGPGETLVSGRLDPGRFAVSRRDLRCFRFTGAPETPVGAVACLDEAQLVRLSKLGLQVEKLFGAPQDIEWTLDAGGRLHIVQSRAITTTAAGRSRVVWSNANVNENFPGPVAPFLYSIASTGYEHYFRNLGLAFGVSRRRLDAADAAFRHIIGVHAARIYYNLTNIHRVLRSVPFGAWLTRSFDDFVGIPADEETEPVEEKLRFWPVVELAWVLIKTGRLYLTLERRVGEFERTADGFAEQWRPERLKDCPLAELLEALHAFVDIRSHRWLGASLADAAAMVTSGALQALLGNERRAAGFGELLSGLPDMVSAQPAVKLWELSRLIRNEPDLDALFRDQGASEIWSTLRARPRFAEFRLAVDEYLENWGFRFSGELMMTVPSFQERPERLMELLKSYLRLDAGSPLERLQAEGEGRLAATERVRIDLRRERLCRRLPLRKSFVFPRLLSWTQTSVILRERARLKQALLYSRCRRIVLAIGEKLAGNDAVKEQDDVFFLTWQELEALLSAGAMFPGLPRKQVAIRKEEHAQWSLLAPPDHFVLPEGAYWDAGTSPASVREEPPGDPRKILYGIGAGTGKVQGPAAVLQDISECGRLRGGDVLVARQTDPGWGPLFPLIKGLVLERGGVLSHGAILAREFGIASVVGVKEATRLIADGRPIEIDGDLGHVHFMD